MRLSYITHEDDHWRYGRTWVLTRSICEDAELDFITDWMQFKQKDKCYATQNDDGRGRH